MEMFITLMFPGITFTRLESRLIAHLLKQPNALCSQEQLLHEVWDYQDGVKTRTVSTTIERVRRKIGAHPLQIQTVWGKGLMLDSAGLDKEDITPIVRHVIGDEYERWCTRYFLSESELICYAGPHANALRRWCSAELWTEAFIEVFGQERLAKHGQAYLQQLRSQETLTSNDIRVLERLVPHVPLDEDTLERINDWSTSSLSPAQGYAILQNAQTTTMTAEVSRWSLMALYATMTKQHDVAAALFEQSHQVEDIDDVMVSTLLLRESMSFRIRGQYTEALDRAQRAIDKADAPIQRAKSQFVLGEFYAECQREEAAELLIDAMKTLSESAQHASHQHLIHAIKIALALFYIHQPPPDFENARDVLQSITEHELHPNSHVNYVIAQALLALRRNDITGERWLRYHMSGIDDGAQDMFDFLHALFQSQRPQFQPELMRAHLRQPSGPWAHIRALTAACVLDVEPRWPLAQDVREHTTHLTRRYKEGALTPINCYFALAAASLERYIL